MNDQKWTASKIIQTSILFAILVFVPLGSWFYLKGGLDYRIKALAELDSLTTFQEFEWTDQNQKVYNTERHGNKLMIGGFLPISDQENYVERVSRLHDQFNNRSDVVFVTIVPIGQASSLSAKFDIKDGEQWKWIGLDLKQTNDLAASWKMDPVNDLNKICLIDEKGVVKNHYDYLSDAEMGRLIEHMAMLLPKGLKRQKEE